MSINAQTLPQISSSLSNNDTTFLTKKRNLSLLQRNYLIRRIISPVTNDKNEYEKISNLYYLLMSLDWTDDSHSKTSLLQNLRGNSLWYYICSNYFPFVSNELVDNVNLLYDVISRYIIERHSNKPIYKKNSKFSKKDKLIKNITSLFSPSTTIDDAISSLTTSISKISSINERRLNDNINKKFLLTNKYDSNRTIDEHLRMDIEYHSKQLTKFVDYIKTKNENRNIANDEIDPDDVVCVICNDGDYEDDNLIVYCSICHITVHQKCYGIAVVPKDDWICHSCKIYNNDTISNNIECVLCPVKGGAMKPCSLKKSSMFYSFLMSLRSSSNSSLVSSTKTLFTTFEETTTSTTEHNNNNNNNGEYINDKIANEHAWVHLSCALWIPEIIISNYEMKEKIKGVESIGKKRFMERCEICLLKGYGPTIKCERCDLRFHVECARVNKFQLESTDNQMGENKFHIFCQRHAPHKLVKARELKKQREIDDIKQFANIIEKNIEMYNKIHKNSPLSVYNKAKGEKSIIDVNNSKIKLNNKEKKSFINAIRNLAIEISSLNIEVNHKDFSISSSSIINLRYIDMLSPSKFPWYLLKESEEYLVGMKPIEIFRLYKSIIPNEVEYNKVILKKTSFSYSKKQKVLTYCYCKKNDDAFMIGCEGGEKCPNGGWYHLECVEELKRLTRDDVQSEKFGKYYCPECRKMNGLNDIDYNTLFNTITNNTDNIN